MLRYLRVKEIFFGPIDKNISSVMYHQWIPSYFRNQEGEMASKKHGLLEPEQEVTIAVNKSHVDNTLWAASVFKYCPLGEKKETYFFFSCSCAYFVHYCCYSITMHLHWFCSKYPNSQILTYIIFWFVKGYWHELHYIRQNSFFSVYQVL